MADYLNVKQSDITGLASKLDDFGRNLSVAEGTILLGVLALAEQSLPPSTTPPGAADGDGATGCDSAAAGIPKKILRLERQVLRDLNIWDRLLQVKAHSLWTCNGRVVTPGEEVVNPRAG